jgi:Mg-chelatase subunit ChlD
MRIAGWFALTAGGFLWLPSKIPLEYAEVRGAKDWLELPSEVPGPIVAESDPFSRVAFHGQTLEGDGFFFLVDTGRTMLSSGGLERTKGEIIRSILDLSPGTQFALVFFGTRISAFPSNGQPADVRFPVKSSAVAWVHPVAGGYGTSMLEGFREAIAFANRSSARKKIVIYIGDSGVRSAFSGGARDLVEAITAMNAQRVRIDCIDVVGGGRARFLKELAAANGGSYRRLRERLSCAGGEQATEEKRAERVVE